MFVCMYVHMRIYIMGVADQMLDLIRPFQSGGWKEYSPPVEKKFIPCGQFVLKEK